jgi:Bacterial self-protective colicin-like immunity
MAAPTLDEWIALVRAFVEGTLAPDDFGTTFFAYFRDANRAHDEGGRWVTPTRAEAILGEFCVEVDCLSNDPELFPELTVTPDELRETARGVLAELERIRDDDRP